MDWKTRIPALILWLALVFSSLGDGNAEQRVVCYYTNWSVYRPGTAKFSPQNINPYLCTHLIYAFGGFTKENTLKPFDKYQDIEKGGYAKFTGLKTYNKNLKTMLAIGGWNEGSSRFSPMVADPGRRKEFVKNSVKFLRQNHFDGLDLDWEYPAFRDGGKPRDRNNYADLVQELREEFERESSKTGRPRLLLSMAVPAGIEYIDKGYDVPRLNDYLDFINLLSYDYHSAFEPAVNHHAPLYPLEEDNEYNYDTELTIDYSIEHLLKNGASSEKIVLGIPTYGRSYTLFNEDATDIGAPADGPGEEGDATREKGYLAYYEICESVAKSDEWEVVQPNPTAMGPYAFRANQWVGYDDEDIVRAKARYVNEKKLGGIMFWSIDNDDFRGKCHGRPYPLIEAAKETMLAGDEKNSSGPKTKLSDNRKKTRTQAGQRIQGNTIGRKLTTGNRRTTTSASRRRVTSSRLNSRSNGRGGNNAEEDEEDEEEETNSVRTVEKSRPRIRSKPRSKNRGSSGGRRKQQQNSRKGEDEKEAEATNEESLSNKFTTPEPPTTPDPGSDFKCEDEGFFPHPRDCKKYFWCLDSGPSGLGIVAHQFTCPSGLVFNKAADSCDYPRNVVCPKAKTAPSTVTTTRAPITAATSRTTYLYKPTQRTTTSKPESEEEYEYYDDEEEDTDSSEIEEEPRITTSAKPLLYKTINRSRPTTTTSAPITTTTETSIAASTRTYKTTSERVTSFEDEEDPRVIKELIDLIRKAGGIEQLEKQLNYQEKNSGGNSGTTEENGRSTPATISRSLYERVLNRQATRITGGFLGSLSTTQSAKGDKSVRGGTQNSRNSFVNGPGGAQFEGLDDVPEVKNLRRTNKPQYVTIERNRTPTSESPLEDDEEIDDEVDEDNTNVASSEDQAVSNPPHQRTSNRRVTPSYVNIRRPRPSPTTSENDVEVKDEDSNAEDAEDEEESIPHRHRVVKTEDESSSPKSRYTNTQRFRSTTSRSSEEDQAEEVAVINDFTTESTTTTTTTTEKIIPITEEIEETPSSTSAQSSTTSDSSSSSTLENISSSIESTTSSIPESTNDSSLKLVEPSATEILFTTAAASSSSSAGSSPEPFTRGPSTAAVSQPRPFGFPRRGRPTSSTSSVAPVTEQSRIKVVSETLRLPTLKELVGYTPTQTESIPELTSTITQSSTSTFVNKTIESNALRDERIDRTVPKDQLEILIEGLVDQDENRGDDSNSRDPEDGRDKEIFDNDILGSEEIQRRSSSSSFVAETQYPRSTKDQGKIIPKQSIRRVEVPVKILDEADGEELAELVILRVPESKLNSAILKPVFRVKVLEQDDKIRKDFRRDRIESVPNSGEISSENEVPDDRGRSSTRRRVRINSSPASPTFGETIKVSEDRINSESRPRNRQRIVKARRRTRVQEVNPIESGESLSIRRENEGVEGNQKNSKRRERVDAKLSSDTNATTGYSTESTTTIRATTHRGNLSTPSKTSHIVRGFYVTKSSIEPSSTSDVITTDSSIDSTQYSSATTSNYEKTGKTDFATHSQETVTPFAEGISYIAEESSTYESVGSTLVEPESTTRITEDIYSSEDLVTLMEDKLETFRPGTISTLEDRFVESSTLATTMTEEETSEQPEVTTFRPLMTLKEDQTTDSTILTEATTAEYFTYDSSETMLTKFDHSTENLLESFKAAENRHYGDSPNLENKSITVPTTDESDDNNGITSETERSVRRTTLQEKATTYKGAFSRGNVRFTTVSKSEANKKLSSREEPKKTTKTSEGDGDENLEVREELNTNSGTSTEIYEKTTEDRLTETTESLQASSLRSRDYRRRTTNSLIIDDFTTNSVTRKELTGSTETHEKPTEHGLAETTGSPQVSSLRSRDHRRRTTNSLIIDDSTINSITGKKLTSSTEAYEKTTEHGLAETTGSPQASSLRSRDQRRRTTNSLIIDNSTIKSVTEKELTSSSTETFDKTEYTSSTDERQNLVQTTGSSPTSRLSSRSNENSRRTTKSFESDEYATTIATNAYDKTVQYTSVAPDDKKLSTNFVETIGSDSYSDNARKTTKSISDSDDFTINSATEKDWTITSAEAYDKKMEYASSTPEADYLSTNDVETTESHLYTGPLLEETITVATTTEQLDKITESLEPASTVYIANSREEENQTESIKSIDTTSKLAEITKPWSYVQRTRVTDSTEDYKTESINISNDVTEDIKSETLESTTEAYLTTNRREITTATEMEDAETTNDKIATENIQQTTETMTSTEMETSKQLFSATTLATTIYDNFEESTTIIAAESTTENIIESTTEGNLSTYASVTNEKITTIRSKEKKAYTAIDSSTTLLNTIEPVTPREIKRTRGRVRFTNFAGNVDETGRNKRPVKQVVVRRRLATESNNRHRAIDATSETSSEIAAPKTSRNLNRELAEEKKNSFILHERLAEEKKHSTNLNVQLTEEKKHATNLNEQLTEERKQSTSLNEQLDEEKENSAKANDRLTEDKKNSPKTTDRLADEKKNGTKSMRRRVVVYRGRPRADIVTTTTTMQSLKVSSDEISNDSSRTRRRKWRKRLVGKRARNEEADDQSIAETGDFRRVVIDDSLADFRDLGPSIEDHELANSAEQADDDIDGEVNVYKSSGAFLRRPGSLVRGEGINRSKTKSQGNLTPITLPVGQTAVFSKIQPVVDEIKTDDQNGRAQELAVTLADPPAIRSPATTGRLPFRTASATRKISTTIAPRTEAPTTSRTTPIVRRRQRPRGSINSDRIVENVTTRPRRPAIIDYDYYVDEDDIRLVVKPELKDKLFVTRKGGIRCLDQGNFAHPTSCKKFITCARMVNGQVIGTEYTCPDKLSFDPVGGICNWSAGLGCEDKKA